MSAAVEEPKTVAQPEVGGTTEPAPAPVLAADNTVAPVEEPKTDDAPKAEGEAAAAPAADEAKEEAKADEAVKEEPKEEAKVVEPIYSGALGYKAPGLKK